MGDATFEVTLMREWLDRFTVLGLPTVDILENLERYRIPSSIPGSNSDSVINVLVVNSSYHAWEHIVFSKTISCIFDILNRHTPKILRKKSIKGGYYYHLREILIEPNDMARTATFLVAVAAIKRPNDLDLQWRDQTAKPSQLSLWNTFFEILSISDDGLETAIKTWENMANKWALIMLHILRTQKKLQSESSLCSPQGIFKSLKDKTKVQRFVSECLKAGCDRYAIGEKSLAASRAEVMQIRYYNFVLLEIWWPLSLVGRRSDIVDFENFGA
ncbi:hypothetical protein H072_7082 [Dactylellina haptotyla CBS 200.50]|uniref:Uncharacterized protein n=1 Tax=Dactylellina haptotyla (strain CBS 200.50) TaxID=1284197 RepID=S8A7Y5_DACHA|nr:hypothetical protein H072_7082 [Dactylellina haptotyla CBS 200.50]